MIKKILISLGLFAFIGFGVWVFTDELDSKQVEGITTPDFIGYVVKADDNSFLLTGKVETGGFTAITLSSKDLSQQEQDLIKIGAYLAVWVDGPVMESYPMQATAGKLEKRPSPDEHKQAIRSAEHVLAEVLAKLDAMDEPKIMTPGVEEMSFDPLKKEWKVTLIDLLSFSDTPLTDIIQD